MVLAGKKFFGLKYKNYFALSFCFSSSFVVTSNLVVSGTSVSVANAVLSAAQYGYVDVVSANQTFNITAIIIDKITKIKIGNIQWSTFTWSATVSLYSDKYCKSNGTLRATSSSAVIVDTTAGTINATYLTITEPGMYVIKLQITSSDGVYSIPLTSTAILVIKNTSKLEIFKKEIELNFIEIYFL